MCFRVMKLSEASVFGIFQIVRFERNNIKKTTHRCLFHEGFLDRCEDQITHPSVNVICPSTPTFVCDIRGIINCMSALSNVPRPLTIRM